MADPVDSFLAQWHRFVAERDTDILAPLLADDVSLGAPPHWARLEGRAAVHYLLDRIVHTIDDFAYHRQWRDGRELALEFTGRVGQRQLQGIDLISLDEGGGLVRLDVLMRPKNAIEALEEVIAPQMIAFLAKQRRAAP
jgi:hypothetical protein